MSVVFFPASLRYVITDHFLELSFHWSPLRVHGFIYLSAWRNSVYINYAVFNDIFHIVVKASSLNQPDKWQNMTDLSENTAHNLGVGWILQFKSITFKVWKMLNQYHINLITFIYLFVALFVIALFLFITLYLFICCTIFIYHTLFFYLLHYFYLSHFILFIYLLTCILLNLASQVL